MKKLLKKIFKLKKPKEPQMKKSAWELLLHCDSFVFKHRSEMPPETKDLIDALSENLEEISEFKMNKYAPENT